MRNALRDKGLKMPGGGLSGYGKERDIEHSRKAGFAAVASDDRANYRHGAH